MNVFCGDLQRQRKLVFVKHKEMLSAKNQKDYSSYQEKTSELRVLNKQLTEDILLLESLLKLKSVTQSIFGHLFIDHGEYLDILSKLPQGKTKPLINKEEFNAISLKLNPLVLLSKDGDKRNIDNAKSFLSKTKSIASNASKETGFWRANLEAFKAAIRSFLSLFTSKSKSANVVAERKGTTAVIKGGLLQVGSSVQAPHEELDVIPVSITSSQQKVPTSGKTEENADNHNKQLDSTALVHHE
jgi:hypothetical protein